MEVLLIELLRMIRLNGVIINKAIIEYGIIDRVVKTISVEDHP